MLPLSSDAVLVQSIFSDIQQQDLNVDVSEAKGLFQLLDVDGSGSVDTEDSRCAMRCMPCVLGWSSCLVRWFPRLSCNVVAERRIQEAR